MRDVRIGRKSKGVARVDRNAFSLKDLRQDGMVLPSRSSALSLLEQGIGSEGRILLLTGEAGVGKTWLLHKMVGSMSPKLAWIWVDIGPVTSVLDFVSEIASELGCTHQPGETVSKLIQRVKLAIEESALEGRSWGLIIEEAHLATADILEQIRILSNESCLGSWLKPIVMSGQTSMLRQIRGSRLTSLETRIDLHVHLKPLDADESAALLGRSMGDVNQDALEMWHRDSLGNPAKLIRLGISGSRQGRPIKPSREFIPFPTGGQVESDPEPMDPGLLEASLIPSVPPIQIEEGVIEVGWGNGDAGDDFSAQVHFSDMYDDSDLEGVLEEVERHSGDRDSFVEPIQDRYAALQAFQEWSIAAGRLAEHATGRTSPEAEQPLGDEPLPQGLNVGEKSKPGQTFVADSGGEGFAPYGDLFAPRKASLSES